MKKMIVSTLAAVLLCGTVITAHGGGGGFGGGFAGGLTGSVVGGALMQPREKTVIVDRGGDDDGGSRRGNRSMRRLQQENENLQDQIMELKAEIRQMKGGR